MAHRMLIDGALVEGATTLDVVNPATGAVFATCSRADKEQAKAAVAAAGRAFPRWAALPAAERGDRLRRIADAMEARTDDFARLLVQEQGKPLAQALQEVGASVGAFRWFAGQELPLRTLREAAEEKVVEQRTPLGVVVTITPWNFPMILLVRKLAPALVTGNTVIAKPAPTTPLTTLLLGEVAADILPPGVLNTIVDANDLGEFLSSHPDVAKISFTGSTATGKRVMQSAAGTLKRLTLELGGNDAAIILDDADPKEVAPKVFDAAMLNAGQVCMAAKRVYVPRSLHDAVCAEFARLAAEAIVGDGLEQGTRIGPVQNRQQYDKVLDLIEQSKAEGTLVAGGSGLDRDGYFIAPTVFRDLPDDSRLVTEEQFGPVFPVLVYDTIDEVVERVNDSPFGLGGTIWTKDVERGMAVATRIQSGVVWINKYLRMPYDIPLGGAKQSGFGRENGVEGMQEFTQAKVIYS